METLLDEGVAQEEIDLEEIQNSTNFETTVEEVSTVLAENGDVTNDSNVNNAVESTAEEIIETVNYSPEITSDPIITATVGIEYVYDAEATDPNGDILTYSLVVFPDSMAIDSSTGVISWTPMVDQIGNCEVSIEVSDGELFTTQNFTIMVNPGSTTPNVKLSPSSQTLTQGSQFTLSVVVENVTDLKGANITLNFDAAKLQYSSSDDGGFIPNDTLQEHSIDNINGNITLDIAGLGESGYHSGMGSGTIMTVTFDTIASGSSNITLGATDLRDNNNVSITHTTGSGCSVTIN